MLEVVGTFSSTEAWQERANGSPKTRNRSLGGLAQKCFEWAEGQLDGIEVGRVLGQVTKCRPCTLRSANGSPKTRNRSLGGLAQKCFEWAEGQLDGIEVGRVLGQVTKCRPCTLDRVPYARAFVSADIVHH